MVVGIIRQRVNFLLFDPQLLIEIRRGRKAQAADQVERYLILVFRSRKRETLGGGDPRQSRRRPINVRLALGGLLWLRGDLRRVRAASPGAPVLAHERHHVSCLTSPATTMVVYSGR